MISIKVEVGMTTKKKKIVAAWVVIQKRTGTILIMMVTKTI